MPPIDPNTNRPPEPTEEPEFELVDDAADRWNSPAARLPIARVYDPRLARWVRGTLVLIALGFATIFAVAVWINPYDADGNPKSMATHTQLGLPPCNMVVLTGKPCPACGMTTSFSLLAHGDVWNSLRANWAGTALATLLLVLIPWSVASSIRGKYYFIRSGEALITAIVIGMLVLMLGRWGIVLIGN